MKLRIISVFYLAAICCPSFAMVPIQDSGTESEEYESSDSLDPAEEAFIEMPHEHFVKFVKNYRNTLSSVDSNSVAECMEFLDNVVINRIHHYRLPLDQIKEFSGEVGEDFFASIFFKCINNGSEDRAVYIFENHLKDTSKKKVLLDAASLYYDKHCRRNSHDLSCIISAYRIFGKSRIYSSDLGCGHILPEPFNSYHLLKAMDVFGTLCYPLKWNNKITLSQANRFKHLVLKAFSLKTLMMKE